MRQASCVEALCISVFDSAALKFLCYTVISYLYFYLYLYVSIYAAAHGHVCSTRHCGIERTVDHRSSQRPDIRYNIYGYHITVVGRRPAVCVGLRKVGEYDSSQ